VSARKPSASQLALICALGWAMSSCATQARAEGVDASNLVGADGQVSASNIPVLTTLLLAAAEPSLSEGSASSQTPTFTQDDELILLIRTQRLVLGESVTGYGTRAGVYLPLGELSRVLDLAIIIGPDGDTASGWFISENRTFALSLSAKEAVVAGKRFALSADDAVARDGEIYVRTDRLAQWLPIKIDVSLSALEVRLTTLEPFPFETRIERDAARDRLRSLGAGSVERLPFEATPFKALTVPAIDVVARLAQSGQRGTEYQYDVRASGDLAFMAANLFVGGSDRDGLSSARLSLGRMDPEGRLLGPLRARQFAIGDIFAPSFSLGPRSVGGRGALVSNVPLDRVSVFDRVDLRGELQSGFEVELYRNNVLIGSTKEARDGQYEFLQVPLDFGANILRLVFFGPRGERREEVRRISVGDGRLAKGDFRYSIAAAQRDTSLFDVRDKTREAQRDVGSWEASAQFDYGLSPFLTLSSGVQQFQRFGEEATMALVGLRTSLSGIAVKLDVASQTPGGSAVALGIGGRALGVTYGLIHSEYNGEFLDEVRRFGDSFYTRQSEAQLSFDVPFGSYRLPFQLRALRSVFVDGDTDSQASLRTGWSVANLLWSNTLDYQSSTSANFDQEQLRGSLSVSTTRAGNGQFRAGLDYDILPSFEPTSFTVNYDRDFSNDLRARFQVSQDLRNSSTRLGASVSRLFKTYELALDSFYDTQTSEYTIGVRLGFSLGRNPQNGHFVQRRLGLAQGGSVAARVFKDLNGNSVFDAGDIAVQGARVVSSGSGTGMSDADGNAFIPNVGENRRAAISLDTTTLDNIYLQPSKGKFEILPRAGRVHVTDIPLIETGEAEGVVRFVDRNGSRPVSAVGFNVIDSNGSIVARLRSEADGFFLIESIPIGTYRIELDPDQAARLNIKLVTPISFTIQSNATSSERLRIEVQRK
jgi:hypothetical protein